MLGVGPRPLVGYGAGVLAHRRRLPPDVGREGADDLAEPGPDGVLVVRGGVPAVEDRHHEAERLGGAEHQGRQPHPAAEPVAAVGPAHRLDRDAGLAQDRDVAAGGPVGDAESLGELVGGAARSVLQDLQGPQGPRGRARSRSSGHPDTAIARSGRGTSGTAPRVAVMNRSTASLPDGAHIEHADLRAISFHHVRFPGLELVDVEITGQHRERDDQRRRHRPAGRCRAQPPDARADEDAPDHRRGVPGGVGDPGATLGRDRGPCPRTPTRAAARAGPRRVVLHRDAAPPRLRERRLGRPDGARRPRAVAPARPARGTRRPAGTASPGTARRVPRWTRSSPYAASARPWSATSSPP